MNQDQNQKEQELSEILKAIHSAGVVADGGLGRQCTVLLNQTLARKKAKETGLALETIQLDTAMAIGNWQATQSISAAGERARAAGLVYIVRDDEASASDMTRFASAISSMDADQVRSSALYCSKSGSPTLWANEMISLCMECDVQVFDSVEAIRSHYE